MTFTSDLNTILMLINGALWVLIILALRRAITLRTAKDEEITKKIEAIHGLYYGLDKRMLGVDRDITHIRDILSMKVNKAEKDLNGLFGRVRDLDKKLDILASTDKIKI